MTILGLLRLSGASLVALAAFHAVLWRRLHWDRESERLSPLNARVFAVHVFFIAFVLCALGLLSLVRPQLLVEPSELGRHVLIAVVAFWGARLVAQPLVFDPVMRGGRLGAPWLRRGATLLWASYAAIYGAALWGQLRP